jgi:hypothetical protein
VEDAVAVRDPVEQMHFPTGGDRCGTCTGVHAVVPTGRTVPPAAFTGEVGDVHQAVAPVVLEADVELIVEPGHARRSSAVGAVAAVVVSPAAQRAVPQQEVDRAGPVALPIQMMIARPQLFAPPGPGQ